MKRQPEKPSWLKVKTGGGPAFERMQQLVTAGKLHTVCEEALCPNRGECWNHGRATFMILGGTCTRNCSFCNVVSGRNIPPPDPGEPGRVADAVRTLGLREVVITSVTRDDLPDAGSGIWADTIEAVHATVPDIMIETLIPDFKGSMTALETVTAAHPEILGHNLETIPALYPKVRPQADYRRSLRLLSAASAAGSVTKTGLMAGLGETSRDIMAVMRDALDAGCMIFSIGQYLRPSKAHIQVDRYLEPREFDDLRAYGLELGFRVVIAGPLVRSSYHSEEQSAFLSQYFRRNQ